MSARSIRQVRLNELVNEFKQTYQLSDIDLFTHLTEATHRIVHKIDQDRREAERQRDGVVTLKQLKEGRALGGLGDEHGICGTHQRNEARRQDKEQKIPYELDVGVKDRIDRVIAQQLGLRTMEIKPEKRIIEDFGADSLDTVELVMALEDEFGKELDEELYEKCSTVRHIYDLVAANVK